MEGVGSGPGRRLEGKRGRVQWGRWGGCVKDSLCKGVGDVCCDGRGGDEPLHGVGVRGWYETVERRRPGGGMEGGDGPWVLH